MHMVAIGWLWVAFMMAISEKSAVAGVMTFVFYGLVPCAVLLYILNKHAGKRRQYLVDKRAREAQVQTGEATASPEAEVSAEKKDAAREP